MTTVFKVQHEVNPRVTLENTGFADAAQVHYNMLEPALLQAAVSRGEGDLGRGGAFLVSTGRHTGLLYEALHAFMATPVRHPNM